MSGKRWTFSEDAFLHAYFDGVGDFIGEHDLGRPKGAATARVRRLRKCGAWAALDKYEEARTDYLKAIGVYIPWPWEEGGEEESLDDGGDE